MFGFTYTDAMQSSYLVVSVVDDNGRTEHYYPVTLDGTYEGGTNEDRFIGFISSVGIRQVEILNAFFGLGYVATLEFDHIQFGNTVPELHYQLSPLVFTSLLLRNFKRST